MSPFVLAFAWILSLVGINAATQTKDCTAYYQEQQQKHHDAGETLAQQANFPQGHLEIWWRKGNEKATADAYAVEDEAPNELYKKVGECVKGDKRLYHYQGALPVVVQGQEG